ncbi:hypothetical protein [Rhizosphaericola mali]|uniref:Uncharacterized protein n=1 Tax=Rhizosphaericola mali TaxID=2545455 RepID=A0A5P2G795_9BACT|nr:hypothetical protein [Rhizosphaericola mali]QES89640.1 hypothetical protein E0W69_013530 [Rhizosphaericola mali]
MKLYRIYFFSIFLIISVQLFGQNITGVYRKVSGTDNGDEMVIKKICDYLYIYTVFNRDSSRYFDGFAHFGLLNLINSHRFYGKINDVGYLLDVSQMKNDQLSITYTTNSHWKNQTTKSKDIYQKTKDAKYGLSIFDHLDYYLKGINTYDMYYAFENGRTMDVFNLPFECKAHSIAIQKGDSLKVFPIPNLMDVEKNADAVYFVELQHRDQKTAYWIMPTKKHPILAYYPEKGPWKFQYSKRSDGSKFTTDTSKIH